MSKSSKVSLGAVLFYLAVVLVAFIDMSSALSDEGEQNSGIWVLLFSVFPFAWLLNTTSSIIGFEPPSISNLLSTGNLVMITVLQSLALYLFVFIVTKLILKIDEVRLD